jgi:hypothetical protein
MPAKARPVVKPDLRTPCFIGQLPCRLGDRAVDTDSDIRPVSAGRSHSTSP